MYKVTGGKAAVSGVKSSHFRRQFHRSSDSSKRRTCELLYPVSFAFFGLAPQYTVTYPPFNAPDIKRPVFAALPPFLSLFHSSASLSCTHRCPPAISPAQSDSPTAPFAPVTFRSQTAAEPLLPSQFTLGIGVIRPLGADGVVRRLHGFWKSNTVQIIRSQGIHLAFIVYLFFKWIILSLFPSIIPSSSIG